MSKPALRVCFVIQKLFGLAGGAERIFLQTATAMAARGMDVEVIVYDTTNAPVQFDTAGLPVTNLIPAFAKALGPSRTGTNQTPRALKKLPNGGIMGHLKWSATHGLFAYRLKAALRERRPDVVVAFMPPAIAVAVRAGRDLGVPVIASTHNVPEEDFGAFSLRWDQNPVYRRRARAALSQAVGITVLQESFRDWFTPEERSRVTVMPNAIGRLSPRPPTPAPREKQVLAVGRLTGVKRLDLLVAAWARIEPEFPDWRVSIYGEGPDRPALTAQIAAAGLQDRITFCGLTTDLGPVYDSASLLCHPATFEGFGLAVAEAMAHGTPVMGFADCSGINRLVSDGVDGWLLDPGTDRVTALANGLKKALRDPASLRDRGAAAEEISQRYSPDTIAAKWETLIHKAASQP